MKNQFKRFLDMIQFSHSIFALPFALSGAWLAAGGMPHWEQLLGILGACICARSAAMGFNRLVDRHFDALNPRTSQRALPTGSISVHSTVIFVALNSLLFVAFSAWLNPLCLLLSPLVLAVLFLYSWTKRWTALTHLFLGLSLGLAPLGAWLAVRGDFEGRILIPLLLGAAVLFWVAGFDLIYSCQDIDFDRKTGLHSIPARYGAKKALVFSALFHFAVLILLALLGIVAELGIPYWIGFALAACLLCYEHWLVRPNDLSRVNLAFFTLNGWVGIGLFGATAIDFLVRVEG